MTNSLILSPLQVEFLERFFAGQIGRQFFLTGGTALAAFYFQHRYSEDLDLFSTSSEAMERIRYELEIIASELKVEASTAIATPTLRQIFFKNHAETLKVDLVRDIDVQFGQHRTFGNVIVDSLENIGANKVTAIFGRTESKDFVDLYFILQAGYSIKTLIEMAKEKDRGLTEFYLAGMMRQVRNLDRMPRMIKPLSMDTLKQFYLEIEETILRDIKPE